MSFGNRTIKIKTKTWVRDSYGLYDYENNHFHAQSIKVTRSGKLIRTSNDISYVNYQADSAKSERDNTFDSKDESEVIGQISEGPDGIRIIPESNTRDEGSDFWMVVERGEEARGHMASPNDIIKLGRVMFKIKQFKLEQENQNFQYQKSILDSIREHMENVGQGSAFISSDQKVSISGHICKICLSEKSEKENPLISPCGCTGSVKYVHLECLQAWVKSKLNMQQNRNIITIFWKNLNCELCKCKLPLNISHEGEELTLIPFDNRITGGSYVVMESFSKDKDPTGIHIIDLTTNQNFRMGRGHDCDLKIQDISVSRIHAFLVVQRGRLYIKDNSSKFGTLVLRKDPIVLNDTNDSTNWIQCGRTIMKFNIKKPWFRFLPCLGACKNGCLNVISLVFRSSETITTTTTLPPKKDSKSKKKVHKESDDIAYSNIIERDSMESNQDNQSGMIITLE